MVSDRIRPRTATAQQRSNVQHQPMKKRGASSKYTANGVMYQDRNQMPQAPPRSQRHEDQDEDLSEFKAAKRIESADLLAKLKVQSLRKYCAVHNIELEDQPASKDEMFTSILRHWKRQVVDDKQVLHKFALTLQKSNAREEQ